MAQNENVTNPQGGDLSELKKMFNDYQNKQNQKKRKTSEEILAKYFVPRKNKEIFRILPPKAGKKYIEEAFFHVAPTNASGGKKKHGTVIYCPAHNDPKVQKVANGKPVFDVNGQPVMIPAPCPLCDKAKKLLARQNPALKGRKKETLNADELKIYEENRAIFTEANKWEAKKFYIVRGIDKGAEKDGVKFWRFKHNFKNQGTLDKLLPILREYTEIHQADFADPKNGTDLSITMSDSEFNGHVYKQISAITFRGKTLLHGDTLVSQEWLEDNITWREVFQPKKAPNITPYEFLEMVAMGTNPYWDDTDSNNKHWVFPGRPDLEEQANTRNRNLDADDEDAAFEQASDLIDDEYPRVTISNITADKVGEYKDDAVNVGQSALNNAPTNAPTTQPPVQSTQPPIQNNIGGGSTEYDDLPF
jgi:glutaredoxin